MMMLLMLRRVLTWTACVLFLGAATGMGVYFARAGLARADQSASVISAFLALAGLALTGFAIVTEHGRPAQAPRDERDTASDLHTLISRVEDEARSQAADLQALRQGKDAHAALAEELRDTRNRLRETDRFLSALWRLEELRPDPPADPASVATIRCRPTPLKLLVAAASGMALAAVGISLWARWGLASTQSMLTTQGVGLCFVTAGIMAWRMKPEDSGGPWMIALGDLILVSNLQVGLRLASGMPGREMTVVVGALAQWSQLAVAGQLLLNHFGPMPSASEKLLVKAGWVLAIMGPVLLLPTATPIAICGDWCGPSPIHLTREPSVYYAVRSAYLTAWISVALCGLGVITHRFRRATRRQRRLHGFSMVATGTLLALFALGYLGVLAQYASGSGTLLSRAGSALATATAWTAVAAVPVAFLTAFLGEQAMLAAIARLLGRHRQFTLEGLQAALRAALRDPTLCLITPNSLGILLDTTGRPLASAPRHQHQTVLGAPPIAVLLHDPSLVHDRQLLDSAADAACLILRGRPR
jgi:hypothetical protein